jgi:two-component system, NtrC family, sensor kinase
MPIRKKVLCGAVSLAITLLLLMISSLRGVYAYRELAQMISQRAAELPASSELQKAADDLRFNFRHTSTKRDFLYDDTPARRHRERFRHDLDAVSQCLARYQSLLKAQIDADPLLTDRSAELQLVRQIDTKLTQIKKLIQEHDEACLNRHVAALIETDLEELGHAVHKLPTYFQERMANFREEVRIRYRTWNAFIVFSAGASFLILGITYWFFRHSVVQPFKSLLAGTRVIARGNFEHRIETASHDELSELAEALNSMTARFVAIRDHLNEEVQQRTQEVVRSEQLASVGFLAAGVAHEINNPLASIAWSAEALESRLHEILHGAKPETSSGDAASSATPDHEQLNILRKYLKRIQDEAFRCKGITERLLDFSRLGESQKKQTTDVNELVEDVIALVQHLTPYRNKRIEFEPQHGLTAWVSPPEFKQVVLNLLTNALDSTDDQGWVRVQLNHDNQQMVLTLTDNGCGMSQDVLKHLYEPFFTRRRDGKGTGLGLSITYRIVQDHGGKIVATSDGPGCGSRFQITIPLEPESSTAYDSIKQAA